MNDIPLIDSIDAEILMHRDSHFGSNFDIMLEYYEQDGVGVMPDFEISRIKHLQTAEIESGTNLSDKLLPETAIDVVEKAKQLYVDLREVYEADPPNEISCLLSNLILSEEEHPTEEIKALVEKGSDVLDPLIDFIDSATFYDPLFPGYGRAPQFAAECLSLIGDSTAIPHLFSAIGRDFSMDEALISALSSFGDAAKTFLIDQLSKEPFNKDNEHAAIVLTSMEPNEEVAKACLSLFIDPKVQKMPSFASYLAFGCEGLVHENERKQFFALSKAPNISDDLKVEILIVTKQWNS